MKLLTTKNLKHFYKPNDLIYIQLSEKWFNVTLYKYITNKDEFLISPNYINQPNKEYFLNNFLNKILNKPFLTEYILSQ